MKNKKTPFSTDFINMKTNVESYFHVKITKDCPIKLLEKMHATIDDLKCTAADPYYNEKKSSIKRRLEQFIIQKDNMYDLLHKDCNVLKSVLTSVQNALSMYI